MATHRWMVGVIPFSVVMLASFVGASAVIGCACTVDTPDVGAAKLAHSGLEPAWWEQVRVTTSDTIVDVDRPARGSDLSATEPDDSGEPDHPPVSDGAEVVVTTYEIPADVTFATDSSELTQTGVDAIGALVPDVGKVISISVAGHSDPRGTREHNMQLSGDRADSVVDQLVGHGIDPDLITTEAVADDRLLPQQPGQDRDEWLAANRRVVIIVTTIATD